MNLKLILKSIFNHIISAFLFYLKLIFRNRNLFSRRLIKFFILILLASVIFIPGLYSISIIYGSADYKDVLDVRNKNEYNSKSSAIDIKNEKEASGVNTLSNKENILNKQIIADHTISLLFLGIDRTEYRDKTIGVSRSDTIAVASVNLNSKNVDMLYIPRDTYTLVPINNKMDKINHAYAYGFLKGDGVKAAIEAVEGLIKYSGIDYYLSTDMEPIPEIVDKIGGVELNVDFEIKNVLSKGKQLLDGKKALEFIRNRHTPRGDIDRIIHQHEFALSLLNKLKNSDKLIESLKLFLSYHKYIKTNMDLEQLASFVRLWSDIPIENFNYYILPGNDKIINKISYYIPDPVKTDEILRSIFK